MDSFAKHATPVRPLKVVARLFKNHQPDIKRLMIWIGLAAISDALVVWMVLPLLTSLSNPAVDVTQFTSISAYLSLNSDWNVSSTTITIFLFGLLLTTCAFKMVFQVMRRRAAAQMQWKVRQQWMRELMSQYLHADYLDFAHRRVGKLLDSLIVESRQAALFLFESLECLGKIAQLAILICVLMLVSSTMALVALGTALLGTMTLLPFWRRVVTPLGQQHVRLNQNCKAVAAENITMFADIKALGVEQQRLEEFDDQSHLLAQTMVRQATIHSVPQPLGELLLVGILLLSFGGTRFFEMETTAMLPLFGFGFVIMRRMLSLAASIAGHAIMMGSTLPALMHVFQSMEQSQSIEGEHSVEEIPHQIGAIQFHEVDFAYPGQSPVLTDFNINLPPGSITAVVGPSGLGKSTLARLILGFVRPKSGMITIDGCNLGNLDARQWRQRIGYVSQDTVLFQATIEENITLGAGSVTSVQIRDACRLAGAEEFIEHLPEGMETFVGERGVRLSAGERQRIAIARALVRDPSILIFDEATSALDNDNAKLIEETVAALRGQKTILFITHRTDRLMFADQILKMDTGSIQHVENGEPEFINQKRRPALQRVA